MNKKITLLALVCSFVFVSASAFAAVPDWAQGGAPGAGATVCGPYQPTEWNGMEATQLIGQTVQTPTDLPLGQISDLVIDQANDRVALVILSDVPRMGEKKVAIPYSALERTGNGILQLSFGSKQLEQPEGSTDLYVYNVTRLPASSDLYGIPSSMDPRWVTEVYSYYGHTPYWTEKGQKPIAAANLYMASKLTGGEIRLPEENAMAKVDDLVINTPDGQIAFASLMDVPGRGGALVAVPFSFLTRKDDNTFALNLPREKLAAAPTFNEYRDMTNREWAESAYKLFGVQPCWMAEEATR